MNKLALTWLSTSVQLLPDCLTALQAAPTAPLLTAAAAVAPTDAPTDAPTAAATAAATVAPSDAAAAAEAPAELAAPQPAQPTPAVRVEAAHKQLKSYLPGELCKAFRETGLKYDLYDWQVRTIQCIVALALSHTFDLMIFLSCVALRIRQLAGQSCSLEWLCEAAGFKV